MQTILDTQIPNARPIKKYLITGFAALLVLLLLAAYSLDHNGVASLDRASLTLGEVKVGTLIRDVHAPGNLVAKHRQWLTAQTSAKISERLLEPGAIVSPDSVILRLSSPDLSQEFERQKLQLEVVKAQLDALRETQNTERQKLRARVSLLEVEKQQAIEDTLAKQQLRVTKIIPEYQFKEAQLRERKLTLELEIARFELQQLPSLQASLLKVEQTKVAQQKLQVTLLQDQVARLDVKAGMHGVLQSVSVEEGQEISKGTELAQVAEQSNLKAELRVQEGQAKDIQLGQIVNIDTRRSDIQGRVVRIDPAVQNGTVTIDVALPSTLPREARPDLRVNGIIEIERVENVLLLDKPAGWRETQKGELFKLDGEHIATKTPVTFGSHSTRQIQLKSGLKAGDRVILSPLPELSSHNQINLH